MKGSWDIMEILDLKALENIEEGIWDEGSRGHHGQISVYNEKCK